MPIRPEKQQYNRDQFWRHFDVASNICSEILQLPQPHWAICCNERQNAGAPPLTYAMGYNFHRLE